MIAITLILRTTSFMDPSQNKQDVIKKINNTCGVSKKDNMPGNFGRQRRLETKDNLVLDINGV